MDNNGSTPGEPYVPTDDADVDEELARILPRLQARLGHFDEERAALVERQRAELNALDQKRKHYQSLLRAAGFEQPATTQSRVRRPSKPSPRTLATITEALLTEEGPFTALDIHRRHKLPWGEPHTYVAFSYLKSIEFLGKVRHEATTNRVLYRVLDRRVGEELLEKIKTGQAISTTSRPTSDEQVRNALFQVLQIRRETQAPVTIRQLVDAGTSKHTAAKMIRLALDQGLIEQAGQRNEHPERHGRASATYEPDEAKITEALNGQG